MVSLGLSLVIRTQDCHDLLRACLTVAYTGALMAQCLTLWATDWKMLSSSYLCWIKVSAKNDVKNDIKLLRINNNSKLANKLILLNAYKLTLCKYNTHAHVHVASLLSQSYIRAITGY